MLASKIAALLALVLFGALLLWAAAVAVPAILDVDVTGLDLLALVVHLAAIAVFFGMFAVAAVAFVGVNCRDLRDRGAAVTLLDRLRANPRTAAIADRIAGSARVWSITAKTFSDHQGLMTVVAALLFYMGLLLANPISGRLPPRSASAVRTSQLGPLPPGCPQADAVVDRQRCETSNAGQPNRGRRR